MHTRIGEKSSSFEEKFDDARIRAFAESVKGREELSLPPTIVTIFRRGEFELMEKLGIPLARVLHGEQEYEYAVDPAGFRKALLSGICYETVFSNYRKKEGSKGNLHFLVFQSEFKSAGGGEAIVTSRSTMVVRGDLS